MTAATATSYDAENRVITETSIGAVSAASSKCNAEWQRVEKLIGSVGRDKIEFICGTDVEFPL